MPNWDEDSPKARENLEHVLDVIFQAEERRDTPTLEAARHWQTISMKDLEVPDLRFVGGFRGEPGLENVQVRVGQIYGVDSANVGEELRNFEATLQELVAVLDAELPTGQEPDADVVGAVVDLCAWAHAEWIRIHPFANGNGRTARLWANSLAVRYGLPAFIRLRPRPEQRYGSAGLKAMQGDWKPTAIVFRRLLNDFLNEL